MPRVSFWGALFLAVCACSKRQHGDNPLPFAASDLRAIPASTGVADANIDRPGCDLFAESGKWACLALGSYAHGFGESAGGSKLSVFVVKSLRIAGDVQVRTHEALPVVVVALNDLSVEGWMEVLPGTAQGAIQLIAGGKLTVPQGGIVSADGGGSVLLEATSFELQGTISANGAGGRIRINGRGTKPDLTHAILSPALGTSGFSLGTL